ncbi:MAG: diaminopimelate decarboxylase [Firmicutes bacterium]|nr:diaminopimelate decarboxylase [Bacillota bacterium]MCM1400418.1 diaminopimelate decarboxylase [Bacteroides sp.]
MSNYTLPLTPAIAETVSTPCYLYDMALLRQTVNNALAAAANPRFVIHYAMKANAEQPILALMQASGLGVDTVSGGEIALALKYGFAPEKIVFAGVGKTDAEIDVALTRGIGCLNVESLEELEVIAQRAEALGKVAPVALRVNPDIDAHTHHYITTGLAENKFGIPMEKLHEALNFICSSNWLNLRGLHFHIGSQITIMEPFKILCERINSLQDHYERLGFTFPTINLGGGLGIDYDNPSLNPIPPFKEFFETVNRYLKPHHNQEVHFELGRSLVAQCGTLLSRVLYVKEGLEKRFAIIDAGFTDLIRPALYGAHHAIENLTSNSAEKLDYDVVGPVCESSDMFGEKISLPVTHRGDILAIRSAGAYGSVMAMTYNCRPLPSALFVNQ